MMAIQYFVQTVRMACLAGWPAILLTLSCCEPTSRVVDVQGTHFQCGCCLLALRIVAHRRLSV